MLRSLSSVFICFFLCFTLAAQNNTLKNNNALLFMGPKLGYTEHREAQLVIGVTDKTKKIAVRFWKKDSDAKNYEKIILTDWSNKGKDAPVKITFEGLDMATTYNYEIWLNGKRQNFLYPTQFTTRTLWEWRNPAPDFSFLMGSCAYINDSIYDRPGKPYGRTTEIFETMAKTPSDFMLWLGDNVYLREVDYSSVWGINYRYRHNMAIPQLQAFWASRPHFAIWDDHDFGPNDSNLSYEFKATSLETFSNYWGNRTYGEPNNKGAYGQFTWSDCAFFLIDDRYHRASEKLLFTDPQKTYLGSQQLNWLKNALLTSKASFKFIATGSQALNPLNKFECWAQYPELNELLNFITAQKITGVVFLSGDRHFTEIIKIDQPNAYPLYDITSSPLSSGVYADVGKGIEGNNPNRLPGTLLVENNFTKLTVSGDKNNRQLTITAIAVNGDIKWEQTILAKDLQFGQ